MSRVILLECSPRNPATGAVVPLRLCWKAPGAANYLGQQWEPVVDAPPTFESSIGFDGREFGAQPSAQVGQLVFGLSDRTRAAAGLVWKNAAVTIRSAPWPAGGGNPADGAFSVLWTGQADEIQAGGGFARVTLFDGGQALRVPLATLKFGSSGDALLDSADAVKDRAADTIVPLAFGACRNVAGLLVDRLYNIWLFAARPATAVAGFYDGGAAFTLGVARASLAALQATAPAAGRVDYCLDSAGKLLARPWTEPVYPFTCDATFGVTKAADIASAIVSLRTAMAFRAGAIAAFNTAQPADCGLYVNDASTIAELLDRLFRGLGSWWKVRANGTIDFRQLGFASPALTVPNSRMGAPQRARVVVPTAKRTIGYGRNNRVQSESEIAGILLADTITYADGTPVQALQPSQPGADVTDQNTAYDTSRVNGVSAAALTLQASTAASNASSALSDLSFIAADTYLSRGEKPAVIEKWRAIYDEYTPIDNLAAAFGVTTERTAWQTARTSLDSYLGSIPGGWDNPATNSLIVSAIFQGRFADYYYARTALYNRINSINDNRLVPTGSNAVVNSDFVRGTYGFDSPGLAGGVADWGVNLSAAWSGVRNVMWAAVNSGGAWNSPSYADVFYTRGWTGTTADQKRYGLPVKNGDRVYARALCARHRCNLDFYILVYDKDGNYLGGNAWSGGRDGGAGNGDPANFDLLGGVWTVPFAAASRAVLVWRALGNGGFNPYILMTEPAFGVLPAGQTTLPPYMPGNADPLADQTSVSTSANSNALGGTAAATVLSGLAAAALAASDARAVADGKIDSFYQASPPSGTEGDLWFDTDDGYRQYRFTSGSWGLVSDNRIGTALTAAAGAQATADGKVTTFYAASAPTATALGDLWYNTTTQALSRWSGSAWLLVSDVTAASIPIMTLPAGPTIKYDYTGAALTGELARNLQASRTLGGADVTTTTAWSIVTTGCTATIGAATGTISITAVAVTGKIAVTSVHNGQPLTAEFAVTRENGAAPTGGYVASTSSILGSASGSYLGTNAGPLTVTAGASGTVTLTAPLTFQVTSGGVVNAIGKWRWSTVGGVVSDVAGEIAGTVSTFVGGDPGEIYVSQTKTGLTPGTQYQFLLQLRRSTGTSTMSIAGVATAVGS